MNKKIKILFFLLPLLSFSQDILEGIDLGKLNRIEDYIDIEIKNKKIAGAEFLLARNEAIVSHIAVGFSNLKTKEKLMKLADIIIIATPHKAYKKMKFPKNKEVIDTWGLIEK